MNNYLLPQFLIRAIPGDILKFGKINPSLLYYRYLREDETEDKRGRAKILREQFIANADTSMISVVLDREKAALEQLRKRYQNGGVFEETFKLVDRMIVGIGIDSSFENGILLHWTHGIPYINGEALKGAARNFATEQGWGVQKRRF